VSLLDRLLVSSQRTAQR